MQRSSNKLLCTALCGMVVSFVAISPAAAIERPKTIITEPYDQSPNAITRPAGRADREWRRGRGSPQIRMTPQTRIAPRPDAPRYDGRGRRLNVPGRPDTYDAIGRANMYRPRVQPQVSTPTVRTDAGTRINQLAPR